MRAPRPKPTFTVNLWDLTRRRKGALLILTWSRICYQRCRRGRHQRLALGMSLSWAISLPVILSGGLSRHNGNLNMLVPQKANDVK